MLKQWSLNNRCLPISHRQFVKLALQYQKAAENSFGSKCKLTVAASRFAAAYTTFLGDNIQRGLVATNTPSRAFGGIREISKVFWKNATHVTVNVRPLERDEGLRYCDAYMIFNRQNPRRMDFSISTP